NHLHPWHLILSDCARKNVNKDAGLGPHGCWEESLDASGRIDRAARVALLICPQRYLLSYRRSRFRNLKRNKEQSPMTKRQILADLIYDARRRLEELDEHVDALADRANWAAYVRQQLGQGAELSEFESANADTTLNSITDPGDRLAFAKGLYAKDVNLLSN